LAAETLATQRSCFEQIPVQAVDNALVILHDAQAVYVVAGVRNCVRIEAGGKTRPAPRQADLNCGSRVRVISEGIFQETQARHGGWGRSDQGLTAVIETEQNHTIVLTSRPDGTNEPRANPGHGD
jgi:hypothetical protein